jgi:hypothetical protein
LVMGILRDAFLDAVSPFWRPFAFDLEVIFA